MIISTILRVARGAKNVVVKTAKGTAKAVKATAQTAKKAGERLTQTPEERREVRKAEKKKKRQKKGKDSVKKTARGTVKVAKRLVSDTIILVVGLIEDFLFFLFSSFLAFMLILAVIIPVIAVVITGTLEGVSTVAASDVSMTGGVTISNPNTYDWWGNRETNRMLLTNQWDKDLYDIVAINFELEKYTKSIDPTGYWDAYIGAGTTEIESGTPTSDKYTYSNSAVDTTKEQEKASKNLGTYLLKCHLTAARFAPADEYGDGPVGMSFNLVKDESFDFGPFKSTDISESEYTILRNSLKACNHFSLGKWADLKDNQLYAIYSLPGSFYASYKYISKPLWEGAFGVFDSTKSAMKAYGLLKDENNMTSEEKRIYHDIVQSTYYNKHHGSSDETTARVVEYLTCMIAYSDNKSFSDWTTAPSDGKYDKPSEMQDNRNVYANYFCGESTSGVTVKVLHNGTVETVSGTLVNYLTDFAKSKGRSSQWSDMKSHLTTNAYKFDSNMCLCVSALLIGHAYVDYLVDKLGIVLTTSSSASGSGGSFSADFTASQQNIKNAMLKHFYIGGSKSDNTPDSLVSAAEAYGKANNLSKGAMYDYSTNPFLNNEWCAATVKGLMNEAKLSSSDTSIKAALLEKSSNKYPVTNYADLGISGYGRMAPGEYSTSSAEGYAPYIRVHFTNKSAIRSAGSGGISNYELGADSPQVVKYVSDGKIKVEKETLYKPKCGDVIIYSYGSGWSHVGLCYDYDNSTDTITTIEGNTGSNGGGSTYSSHSFKYADNTSLAWIVEIDYVGLEEAYGVSSVKKSSSSGGSSLDINKYIELQAKSLGNDSTLNGTSQVLDVVVSGTSAKVTTYDKVNGKWQKAGKLDGVSAYVGRGGVGTKENNANEGSSMSPWGAHYLGVNFGGFGIPMSDLKIDWKDVKSKQAYWGESTNSKYLNKFYYANSPNGNSEDLTTICINGSYKYAILIEYNYGTNAKANGGSAFFLHVGSSPTAGCVALSEKDMLTVVKWIDKSKKTRIFIHKEDTKVIQAATVTTSTRNNGGTTNSNTISNTTSNTVKNTSTKSQALATVSELKQWGRVSSSTTYIPESVRNFCKGLSSYCETFVHPDTGSTIKQNGSFTYYSEQVLPGTGLDIPGRTHADGFVVDGDGYIVLAGSPNQKKNHTIIPTPFGRDGKVYDVCDNTSFDIYTE